ncbi:hypothetical protein [Thalassobacillus sp. CUG 92003]|uniref:hypothetical protein n=1 Tax=Thalassobacillus sp. CUG 92003 TaxID=2736641 RepID=UPI0015E736FA|nr:hypothetical protein [Thalassobacillus sp. CUG 92003]
MKNQNDHNFDELIDELGSLPDPDYTKQAQDNIHHNLMHDMDKKNKDNKWKLPVKKIGLGMVGLLAVLLFSILYLPYFQQPFSGENESPTEGDWEVSTEYTEDDKVLFDVSPDPNLTSGKPFGYTFSFKEQFETYEGKELAVYAYHKTSGEKITAVQPTLISEPSPGYQTLERFTATFDLPSKGLWRYVVELDGIRYGDVVLQVGGD